MHSEIETPHLAEGKRYRKKRKFFQGFLLSVLAMLLGLVGFASLDSQNNQASAEEMNAAGWNIIAKCEANGDWTTNTGNGYSGGLQFSKSTWKAFGGTEFAPEAYKATKEQQIYVATKTMQEQGFGAWPTCGAKAKAAGYTVPKELPAKPGTESESPRITPASTTTNLAEPDGELPGVDGGDAAEVDDSELGEGGQGSTPGSENTTSPSESPDSSGTETTESADPSESPTTTAPDSTENKEGSGGADGELYDPYEDSGKQAGVDDKFKDTAYASPLQVALNARAEGDLMNAANQYLSFGRWKGGTGMPEGDLSTSATVGISSFNTNSISNAFGGMMIMAGAFMAYLIGMLLVLAISINLLGSGLYIVDLIFARIVDSFIWTAGTDGTKILTTIFATLLFIFLASMFLFKRSNPKERVKPILYFVLGIILLGFVASQAKNNHPNEFDEAKNPSAIGRALESEAAENDGEAGTAQYARVSSANYSKPSAWAMFSPGWFIAQANSLVGDLTNLINDVSTVISSAVANGVNSNRSTAIEECDLYHKASQAVFLGTDAASGSNQSLLITFDNVSYKLINQSYRLASFGSTAGAGGAWCRFAEMQTERSAAEQAMISRVAGLYSDVVGTGGMGFVDNDEAKIVNLYSSDPSKNGNASSVTPGSIVASDGTWTAQEGSDGGARNGVKAAGRFFGPTLPNLAAISEAKFYFAGCHFAQEKPVTLRPEWIGVTRAYNDEALTDADCQDTIVNGAEVEGGFGQRNGGKDADSSVINTSMAWNFSAFRDDSDANEDNLIEKGAKKATSFLGIDKVFDVAKSVGSLFGVTSDGSDQILSKFDNAESDGTSVVIDGVKHPSFSGNAPRSYWKSTNGHDGFSALIYGFLALVGGWKLGTTLLPVVGGAFIGQVIALLIMVVIALFFLLLLLPVERLRGWFKTGFLVVAASLIVTSVLALVLGMALNFATLIEGFLSPTVGNVKMLQAVVTFLAFYLTFKAILMIASNFLSIDLNSRRGLLEAGIASGSPALRELGVNAVTPFDRKFFNKNAQTTPSEQHGMRNDPKAGTLADLSSERDVLNKQSRRDKAEALAASRARRAKGYDKAESLGANIAGRAGRIGGKWGGRAAGAAVGGAVSGGTAASVVGGAAGTIGGAAGQKAGSKLGAVPAKVLRKADKGLVAAKDAPKNVAGFVKDKAGNVIPFGVGADSVKGVFRALDGISQSASGREYDENNPNSKGRQFINSAGSMYLHPASSLTQDDLAENVHTILGSSPVLSEEILRSQGGQRIDGLSYGEALNAAPGAMSAPPAATTSEHSGIASRMQSVNALAEQTRSRMPSDAGYGEIMDNADRVGTALGNERQTFLSPDLSSGQFRGAVILDGQQFAVPSNIVSAGDIAAAKQGRNLTSAVSTINEEELQEARARAVGKLSQAQALSASVIKRAAAEGFKALIAGENLKDPKVLAGLAKSSVQSSEVFRTMEAEGPNSEFSNKMLGMVTAAPKRGIVGTVEDGKDGLREYVPVKNFD